MTDQISKPKSELITTPITQSKGEIVTSSTGEMSPEQAAVIQAGLEIVVETYRTGSYIARLGADTRAFIERADAVSALVALDIKERKEILLPLLDKLISDPNLSEEARLAVISTIGDIGKEGARARGDAIRELAKKV